MAFNIEFKSDENLEVLLTGDLDINNVEVFKTEVLEKYNSTDIIFDLTNLDYLDSTGLGAIMTVYKEIKENNKNLTIKGAKKNIKKLFIITELDQLFNMED